MSDVRSSDGAHAYYSRAFSELQDEYAKHADESKSAQEKELDRLENAHKRQLSKLEAQNEEILRNIRDEAEFSYQKHERGHRDELSNLKKQIYDRTGRVTRVEADALKDEVNRVVQDRQEVLDHERTRSAAAERAYASKFEDASKQREAELSRAIEIARDNARASSARSPASSARASQSELTDVNRERLLDMQELKQRYESAAREVAHEYERKGSKEEESLASRAEDRNRAIDRKLEKNARAMREAHAREVGNLRKQNQELSRINDVNAKGVAEERYRATRDFENVNRRREADIISTYDDQIEAMKTKQRENESYLSSSGNRAVDDRNTYYTKLLREKEQEFHDERTTLNSEFIKDRAALVDQNKKTVNHLESRGEKKMEMADHARSQALKEQAELFREQHAQARSQAESDKQLLQKELQYRKTSSNIDSVSPAAEEALRNRITREQMMRDETKNARDESTAERIKEEYSRRVADAINDKNATKTLLARELTSERTNNAAQQAAQVTELEHLTGERLRNQEQDHERQAEIRNRSHADELGKQRKIYEDVLAQARLDSSTRLQTQAQDHDFKMRMAQREYSSQIQTLNRTHAKEMSDQKAQHDAQVNELQQSLLQARQDSDKRVRQTIEEQTRNYEQRIAQLEQSHKERERNLVQNYETEIDKIRQSNAILAQKKS